MHARIYKLTNIFHIIFYQNSPTPTPFLVLVESLFVKQQWRVNLWPNYNPLKNIFYDQIQHYNTLSSNSAQCHHYNITSAPHPVDNQCLGFDLPVKCQSAWLGFSFMLSLLWSHGRASGVFSTEIDSLSLFHYSLTLLDQRDLWILGQLPKQQ